MDKDPVAESTQSSSFFLDKNSGKKYDLTCRLTTIGSASECAVRLPSSFSANIGHCLFRNGNHVLHIISNKDNVEVNGSLISSKCILKHGDHVKIQDVELEYYDHIPAIPVHSAVADPVDELVKMTVLLLKNRDKDITFNFITSISRLLRCDAARIVSEEEESGKRYTLVRYPAHAGLDRFSNHAIDWARDALRPILLLRTDWEDSSVPNVSLEKNAIASVICAPLNAGEHLKGYLYLDRTGEDDPFTEQDRVFCEKLLPLITELLINSQERERQVKIIENLQKVTEGTSGGILFRSTRMQKIISLADRISPTDITVLISGETGTGKELMARYIHGMSLRNKMPFKAINCGAVPENLIESELFGHEKGAFTGANSRKIGLFEAANEGTVFLDEIGEMPLQLQVKLLRVLQESEIVRVGNTEPVKVDIRVIAATNRDLKAEVDNGRFRSDLFFRLNVMSILLPPLRERNDDILLLAEYFVNKHCTRMGKTVMIFSGGAREALAAHLWPGNIRELENVIQKAVVLSSSNKIEKTDLEISVQANDKNGDVVIERIPTIRAAREQTERDLIQNALRATVGNVTHTARILDIDRKWLFTKMTEYGICADTYRICSK